MQLGSIYISSQRYAEAIAIYRKIFRKESVKFPQRTSDIEFISSQLSTTYLTAAQSYLDKAMELDRINNLDPEVLHEAVLEYDKIAQLYEGYKNTFKHPPETADRAWEKILKEKDSRRTDACFRFGDEYIKRMLWQDAKYFLTQRILRYMDPVTVLDEMEKRYTSKEFADIRKKIWDGEIFVILEDFENSAKPILLDCARSTEAAINAHHVSKQEFRTGTSSEYFDLSYAKGGYDFWAKATNITLAKSELPLGVSVSVKSKEPFQGHLKVSIMYPKQGVGGIWQTDITRDMGQGWEERRIDNLLEKAKMIASGQNWNSEGMMVDAIIIDTQGISNKFYIDNIKLYVVSTDMKRK